jgi:VanZ family protein
MQVSVRSTGLRIAAWYQTWPAVCRWILPVLWMAIIFGVSAQPRLPTVPGPDVDALLKKGAHLLEYAILVVLFWQALGSRRTALASVLTVLYAVSDEFHQTFVPGRSGQFRDVLIDSAGILLAALALWWVSRKAR